MASKIEIVKRETIKPSSPTPPELREFKLSLIDQVNANIYTSTLLFYVGDDKDNNREFKTTKLKTSLSETLKHFYPLAGRIRDDIVVECDDQGAEFIEASVDARLSEVLEKPDAVALKRFLPIDVTSAEAGRGVLLLVQANFFLCGGLAIGVRLSHKLADAATLSTFLNAWGGVACGCRDVVLPIFDAASMFPPLDNMVLVVPPPSLEKLRRQCVARRFVIASPAIESLKEKAASKAVPHPTTVEVVTSLMWKCAAKALKSNSCSRKQPSMLSMSMNLRNRFDPPLPENLAGNLVGLFIATKTEEIEPGSQLQTLVSNLRIARDDYHRQVVEQLQGENDVSVILGAFKRARELLMDGRTNYYTCTSWCRFPLYEVEFGWGRPVWITTLIAEIENILVLMDTKDREEIEVWFTLSEQNMALLEKDEELLEYAILNPQVI